MVILITSPFGALLAMFIATLTILVFSVIICGVASYFRAWCCNCFNSRSSNPINPSNNGAPQTRVDYQMVNIKGNQHNVSGHEYDYDQSYLVHPLVVEAEVVHDASTTSETGRCRDIWATILFLLNVAFVGIFAYKAFDEYGIKNTSHDNISSEATRNILLIAWSVSGFAIFSILFAFLWLRSLLDYSESIIHIVLVGNIIATSLFAVSALFVSGNLIAFLFISVFAALSYCYYRSVQHRIPFASIVLVTASKAIRENQWGLFSVSVFMQLLQLAWVIIWFVAALGVTLSLREWNQSNASDSGNTQAINQQIRYLRGSATDDNSYRNNGSHGDNQDQSSDPANSFSVMLLLFLSLYWGVQVIKYVLHTTIAGTVAVWWFQPYRDSPVKGSLYRASTTSFGSICFGSLIVAFISTLREIIRQARRNNNRNNNRNVGNSFLLCILDCFVSCLESIAMYVNRYAFCYVAAYGHGFLESGQKVMELFNRRGWNAVINDNLISNVLTMIVFSFAIVMGIIAVIIGFFIEDTVVSKMHFDRETFWAILISSAIIIGGMMSYLLVTILDSAVAMVYVCFAENPAALQRYHPAEYNDLFSTWNEIFPTTLQWMKPASRGASTASTSQLMPTSNAIHAPYIAHSGYSTIADERVPLASAPMYDPVLEQELYLQDHGYHHHQQQQQQLLQQQQQQYHVARNNNMNHYNYNNYNNKHNNSAYI